MLKRTLALLPPLVLALGCSSEAPSDPQGDTPQSTDSPLRAHRFSRLHGDGSAAASDSGAAQDGGAADSGAQKADSGAQQLDSGAQQLDSGAQQLDSGAQQLDSGAQSAWLRTQGNHIYLGNSIWHGRGANLHDPRSCGACAGTPNAPEVNRRMDELVSWGANFIRLVLESSTLSQTVSQDPTYLAQIQSIVAHAAAKPGVYVMISLWVDPTFTSMGWASNPATLTEWTTLATTFAKEPRVLFGVVNEPQNNYDHSLDPQVWTSMNDAVAAIRTAEQNAGGQPHIVAVQGTGGWARFLDYYVTNPITAGGGQNVAYEVHVYDPQSAFAARFENPSKTIPVIIGEFGPAQGYMTLADSQALMTDAMNLEIPHLAWTFHMRCPPNLLVDNSNGGCGVNMALQPTPTWGVPFKAVLAQPW